MPHFVCHFLLNTILLHKWKWKKLTTLDVDTSLICSDNVMFTLIYKDIAQI